MYFLVLGFSGREILPPPVDSYLSDSLEQVQDKKEETFPYCKAATRV